MYDELIDELRHYFADVPLVLQAADALEELSHENESLAKSVNEAAELLHKRRTSPMKSNASNTLDALTNTCPLCGGTLSEIRTDGTKRCRHCYSCHMEQQEETT